MNLHSDFSNYNYLIIPCFPWSHLSLSFEERCEVFASKCSPCFICGLVPAVRSVGWKAVERGCVREEAGGGDESSAKLNSDPHSNLQDSTWLCRFTATVGFLSDCALKPQLCSVETSFCKTVGSWCGEPPYSVWEGRACDSGPQMERSWQFWGWWGHWCKGLALRHGDCGWRRSSSTAARKNQKGGKQTVSLSSCQRVALEEWQDETAFLPKTCNPPAYCINESKDVQQL